MFREPVHNRGWDQLESRLAKSTPDSTRSIDATPLNSIPLFCCRLALFSFEMSVVDHVLSFFCHSILFRVGEPAAILPPSGAARASSFQPKKSLWTAQSELRVWRSAFSLPPVFLVCCLVTCDCSLDFNSGGDGVFQGRPSRTSVAPHHCCINLTHSSVWI